jgi:hypothetical protein
MMTGLFSFKDAVHDHLSVGFVRGCVACAQTEADLSLSKRALAEKLVDSSPNAAK